MKKNLLDKIRAGYACLYIVSHEEQRVEQELQAVLKVLKEQKTDGAKSWRLWAWSITAGIISVETQPEQIKETEEPIQMLTAFDGMKEKSVLMVRDFHMLIADPNPILFRKVKDSLLAAKTANRVIVIVGCRLVLPAELEKLITVLDFELPSRAELRDVMHEVAKCAGIPINKDIEDDLVDALRGLTSIEAENACALSIIETGEVVAAVLQREKADTIKKNGLLEIIRTKVGLDEIGGLENLKTDLKEKEHLFCQEARDYGLPAPHGHLIVGQPGTGKSLTAQAAGNIFGIPLIRLEAGKLFGSLVGQSEGNWRSAFQTAKSIAPCVLWVDEVDGLFCGAKSSGETDSGVTNRVIKAILQDMQYNAQGIFFMFTANDIDGLPDPLIDRLDVWSVELPNKTERVQIWKIHIEKLREGQKTPRSIKKFDVEELAERTEGFSGRQIEQIWLKGLNLAFIAGREPNNKDILNAASRFIATSVTMGEAIKRRRERLKDRAMSASREEIKTTVSRKLAA